MKKGGIFLLLFAMLSSLSFASASSYGAGSYGAGVYGIGETTATPQAPGSGGGGASCVYDWQCTGWFPEECPVSGIQERLCVNKGTCTGTANLPEQTRACEYEHKEPLFDIFLELPEKSKEICAGEKISADIKLENYGRLELLDAFMTYWIVDENNKLIAELKDTRSIADMLIFEVSLKIPKKTSVGTYKLYAQITYSENKTALAGNSFEILDEDSCKMFFDANQYLPFILAGAGSIILIIMAILLVKKLQMHKASERKRRKTLREIRQQKKQAKKRAQKLKKEKKRGHQKALRRRNKLKTKNKRVHKRKTRKERKIFRKTSRYKKEEILKPGLTDEKREQKRMLEKKYRKKLLSQIRNLK
jgi:hypothetical protein